MSSTKGSDAVTAEDGEDDFQTPIVPRTRALKKLEKQTGEVQTYDTGTSPISYLQLLQQVRVNLEPLSEAKTKMPLRVSHTDFFPDFALIWACILQHRKRVMTVKSSINGVSWEARYRSPLEKLVITVNEITTHAYALARYIFLSEIHATEPGERFPMETWLETDFFAEVWLSLTLRTVKSSRTDGTTRYRGLIDRHIKNHLKHSAFNRKALTNSQQIARYERFKHLHRLLEQHQKLLRQIQPRDQGSYIQASHQACARCEQAFITGNTRGSLPSEKQSQLLLLLEFHDALFSAYPAAYEFDEDSVYYDSKSRPGNHALAYVMIAKFCEDYEIKTFQCIPLRTSWIPAHMQIDTKILATQMLKKPTNIDFDSDLWKQVVNF
ncbi:hypothetical protein VTP01DRAFT_6546 [Rhizomucor pusillus]|uniref:uncharacterized protein n=1 Tax=Rhizomucor pusillus TaxID=4840 RepID=UPI003742F5A1